MEDNNIEEAQIVEETPKDNNLYINFATSDKISIIQVKEQDIHKLARVFYELCIDNKVDAELIIKDK